MTIQPWQYSYTSMRGAENETLDPDDDVSRLHVAIVSKQKSVVVSLLDKDPSLLLKRMPSSGWTALHLAARYLMNEQIEQPKTIVNRSNNLWLYILRCACNLCTETENVFLMKDYRGETCIDIFFIVWLSSYLGSQRNFRMFSRSVDRVLEDPEKIDAVRLCLQLGKVNDNSSSECLPMNGHIKIVARFWKVLEQLCRLAAVQKFDFVGDFSVLPFLTKLGSCPGHVARLALALFPELAHEPQLVENKNSTGQKLLLHIWAESPNPVNPHSDGLFSILLQANPNAVCCQDENGRLPLHIALGSGKPFETIHRLWSAFPGALYQPDPFTSVPPIIMVMNAARDIEESIMVNISDSRSSRLKENYIENQNSHRLTLLFQMIRAFPQAVMTCPPRN